MCFCGGGIGHRYNGRTTGHTFQPVTVDKLLQGIGTVSEDIDNTEGSSLNELNRAEILCEGDSKAIDEEAVEDGEQSG